MSPIIRGCDLPEDLYFDVERDVWVRLEDDQATLGMTDLAQTRCGKLVSIRMKKPGQALARGKSAATVESAKWVGPFPVPLSGEIVANNEAAYRRDILVANKDPYGQGWIVKLRPTALEEELPHLVTGEEAFRAYRERIDELDVSCFRCVE